MVGRLALAVASLGAKGYMVGRLALAVASLVLVSQPQGACADLYLNYPRGSNNKLNEVANTRANGNRLFDSQNNANAGYQVGDNCTADAPCSDANNNYDASAAGAGAGVMSFYAGSRLYSEWTPSRRRPASRRAPRPRATKRWWRAVAV